MDADSHKIEQYELAKKEIASSKQMLADAMRDLDVTRNAKESLGEQVKALVAQYNQARHEDDDEDDGEPMFGRGANNASVLTVPAVMEAEPPVP